jgi:oligopeptide/dipeptide ABC transporter ATP-binding protein
MSGEVVLDAVGVHRHIPVRRAARRGPRLVRAVDGVDIRVDSGQAVGIVGESGCGKTSLAQTLIGLQPLTAGDVRLLDLDVGRLTASGRRRLRRIAQPVFQDPYASLDPRFTARDIVAEPFVASRLGNKQEAGERADELLAEVGLDPTLGRRRPHEFSGGQRQRIAIARALAPSPRLLVLDEPTTALDVTVQAQILDLLRQVRVSTGAAQLLIAHDLAVVNHVTDRVVVMYLGRVVEEGPTAAVLSAPAHPYTQALVSAMPSIRRRERRRIVLAGEPPSPISPPSGCRFHTRCWMATDHCRTVSPELVDIDNGRRVACHVVQASTSVGTPQTAENPR